MTTYGPVTVTRDGRGAKLGTDLYDAPQVHGFHPNHLRVSLSAEGNVGNVYVARLVDSGPDMVRITHAWDWHVGGYGTHRRPPEWLSKVVDDIVEENPHN